MEPLAKGVALDHLPLLEQADPGPPLRRGIAHDGGILRGDEPGGREDRHTAGRRGLCSVVLGPVACQLRAREPHLLASELEVLGDRVRGVREVFVWPVRRGHAQAESGTALPDHLLGAPDSRSHAHVADRPDEVVAVQGRLVLVQRQRVAMHRPAVPEQEVARLGADQPRAVAALREHGVVGPESDEVPPVLGGLVALEEVTPEEAVRARDDHEAARVLRGILQSDQTLHTVEPPLLVRLVNMAPALVRLFDPPARVVAVRPEDSGAIEGHHQVLGTPQVREGLLHAREGAEKPEHLGLSNASAVDNPICLPRGPAVAALVGVPPGREVRPSDLARLVGVLDEVPEERVGVGDLLLVRNLRDDCKTFVGQVSKPELLLAELEARRPYRASDRHPRHGLAHVKNHVDVPPDLPHYVVATLKVWLPNPGLLPGVDHHLVAHLLHPARIRLKAVSGQHGLLNRVGHLNSLLVRLVAHLRLLPQGVVALLKALGEEPGAQLAEQLCG
mmetsp:Transcript_90660/g.282324  ORF Transcript_90660/g.282324 Transcript_90660/m.282324 type:complete len:503 (-) Transcript_90660:329-1837(-)